MCSKRKHQLATASSCQPWPVSAVSTSNALHRTASAQYNEHFRHEEQRLNNAHAADRFSSLPCLFCSSAVCAQDLWTHHWWSPKLLPAHWAFGKPESRTSCKPRLSAPSVEGMLARQLDYRGVRVQFLEADAALHNVALSRSMLCHGVQKICRQKMIQRFTRKRRQWKPQ